MMVSDQEMAKTDATAAAIFDALMQEGGPGFAGAVLTLMLAILLAMLSDAEAKGALKHHADNAMAMRKFLRRRKQ